MLALEFHSSLDDLAIEVPLVSESEVEELSLVLPSRDHDKEETLVFSREHEGPFTWGSRGHFADVNNGILDPFAVVVRDHFLVGQVDCHDVTTLSNSQEVLLIKLKVSVHRKFAINLRGLPQGLIKDHDGPIAQSTVECAVLGLVSRAEVVSAVKQSLLVLLDQV